MDENIILSRQKAVFNQGGWIATRNDVKGYGKNKKKAIADLEETERFLRIAQPTKESCPNSKCI